MSGWKTRKTALAAAAAAAVLMAAGCTVSPMDTSVSEAEALTSQIQPTAVTDLSATTTEESSVTFSFSGDPDEISAGAYYSLYYMLGPDYSTTETIPVVPQLVAGQYTFTLENQSAGQHVLAWVVTNIPTTTTSGEKKILSSDASSLVEGSTVPEAWIQPQVSGTTVTLRYGIEGLLSDLDDSGQTMLYPGYQVIVHATHGDDTYTVYDSGVETSYSESDFQCVDEKLQASADSSEAEVTYWISYNLFDSEGKSLLSQEISSDDAVVTTDKTYLPMPVDSITASRGSSARANDVLVTWSVEDYRNNLSNASHRVVLQRRIAGSDPDEDSSWETIIGNKVDINPPEDCEADADGVYSYTVTIDSTEYEMTKTPIEEGGAATYTFSDTSVDYNTDYYYRAEAWYIVGNSTYEQDSAYDICDQDAYGNLACGYKVYLPTSVSVDACVTEDGQTATSADVDLQISWEYTWHGSTALPDGMSFVVYCDDGHGDEIIDSSDATLSYTSDGVTWTKTISLGQTSGTFDARSDHEWTFSVGILYAADSLSPLQESANTGSFTSLFASVTYLDEDSLAVTDSLAEKVNVSWSVPVVFVDGTAYITKENSSESSGLGLSDIHFFIRWKDTSGSLLSAECTAEASGTLSTSETSLENLTTTVASDNSSITYSLSVATGSLASSTFSVEAIYEGENDTYNGTSTMVEGRGGTIVAPTFTATKGTSTSDITLTVDTEENEGKDFGGYKIYITDSDASDASESSYAWAGGEESVSVKGLLGDSLVEGHTFSFAMTAVENDDDGDGIANESARSDTVEGNTLGPVVNSYAQNNTNKENGNDTFQVQFKPMPGATSYTFSVRRDVTVDGTTTRTELGTISVDADDESLVLSDSGDLYSYTFSYNDSSQALVFATSSLNPYPKSTDYYIYIIPVNSDVKDEEENNLTVAVDGIEPVKGAFFGPPAYVSATYYVYADHVELSWDAVEGATGYYLYKKDSSSAEYGSKSATTATNSYTDTISTTAMYYEVEAYRTTDSGTIVSDISSTTEVDGDYPTNLGCRLLPPEYVEADPKPDALYFTVRWKGRPTVTEYVLTQDEVAASAKTVTIPDDITTVIGDEAGDLWKGSDDGYYYYNYSYEFSSVNCLLTDHGITVASKKDSEISSAKAKDSGRALRDLTPTEILNGVNYQVYLVLSEANGTFNQDWWGSGDFEGSSRTYSFESTTIDGVSSSGTVESCSSEDNGWNARMVNGSFTMTAEGGSTQFAVSTNAAIGVRAVWESWTDCGFQGTDSLEYVGVEPGEVLKDSGSIGLGADQSFTLVYPSDYYGERTGQVEITTEIDVQAKTGQEKATDHNGDVTTQDYASVQPLLNVE